MDAGNGPVSIMVKNSKFIFFCHLFCWIFFSAFGIENKNIETLVPQGESTTLLKSLRDVKYVDLDIDYPEHELILKYHNEFNSDFGEKLLTQILTNAEPYRAFIREKLVENNLPLCLEFLPVIESNYNIKAVSKSGAVGLWQFMENSISGLLTKNSWVDERKDPWRSTEAAIKKLKENYDYFGDWALALAAYNMGLGGLSRKIKSTGCKTYWELIDGGHLKSETTNYVPKFLAIADLITNAEYYGLELPEYNPEKSYEVEIVDLSFQISLEQLSSVSKVSVKTLQALNPGLLYSVTPYTNSYGLRVFSSDKEKILSALATLKPLDANIYTVEKGDTLWGISRRYGLTVDALCKANNIKENQILRIGTRLVLPIVKE